MDRFLSYGYKDLNDFKWNWQEQKQLILDQKFKQEKLQHEQNKQSSENTSKSNKKKKEKDSKYAQAKKNKTEELAAK